MPDSRERCHFLSVLLVSLAYLSYFVSKAVFVLAAIPLLILLTPFPAARHRVLGWALHRYLGFFTRQWLPWLRVYRLGEISGLEHTLAARPAVVVANHRSYMDAILLLGLLPSAGVLIKARDTRQPMYAILARYFDLVSLDREALSSVSASLEKCRLLLARGQSLLVFPEGTRARSGRLQHFNRIAFELALQAGRPVIPVIVHSAKPFMAKIPGSLFPRGRNEFRVQFLEPERPRPGDDAGALSDRVHRRMAVALKPLDAGTCWAPCSPLL